MKAVLHAKLLLPLSLFLATLILFEHTNLDLVVQDLFFNFNTGTWLVDSEAPLLRLIFYSGIKGVIIAVGIVTVICFVLSFKNTRLRKWRQGLLLCILSLALVPLLVAGGKQFTNVYCPYQIQRYDGVVPYVKLLGSYPETFHPKRRGKCFPAGHATGGFAFMALYYVFKKRRARIAGLGTGLILGWTMGLYQMFKGAHYLSHTVVTMLLAWIIICVIHTCVISLGTKKGFGWIAP